MAEEFLYNENISSKEAINPTNFLNTFIGLSRIKDKTYFDKNILIDFILKSKSKNQFGELLDNISFTSDESGISSETLENSFFEIYADRTIFSIPNEGINLVFFNKDKSIKELLESNEDYIDDCNDFAFEYYKYCTERYYSNIDVLSRQEEKCIEMATKSLRKIREDKKAIRPRIGIDIK